MHPPPPTAIPATPTNHMLILGFFRMQTRCTVLYSKRAEYFAAGRRLVVLANVPASALAPSSPASSAASPSS
eukprot:COSAG02_NODE_3382_length_6836_cov_12.958290_3_plen_72_part_00